MNNKIDFGGIHVIVFGHLFQLKPVMDNWTFQSPKSVPYAEFIADIWKENFGRYKNCKVAMLQFPLQPAAAITIQRSQGRTPPSLAVQLPDAKRIHNHGGLHMMY